MSTLKKVLLVLAIGIGGFAVFVATRPDSYKVERTAKIEAPADVVFAQLDNFKAWSEWSPWDKLDPNMKKTFEGPAQGVGASYSWQGNDKVGKGKMTVTEVTPPTAIAYRLEFIEPFASVAQTRFSVKPEGDKAAAVTWAMEGKNNFIGKAFGVFMDMDKMIGKDFDKGLGSLKTIVEAEAAKRAATPPAQAIAK